MKSKLTYLVLFSVVGLVDVTAAETTGLAVTSAAAYAVPFGTFIISFVLLTLMTDYARPQLPLSIAEEKHALLPVSEVFGSTKMISRRPAIARRSANRTLVATH